jgi:hypothetical protein
MGGVDVYRINEKRLTTRTMTEREICVIVQLHFEEDAPSVRASVRFDSGYVMVDGTESVIEAVNGVLSLLPDPHFLSNVFTPELLAYKNKLFDVVTKLRGLKNNFKPRIWYFTQGSSLIAPVGRYHVLAIFSAPSLTSSCTL